MSDTVQSLPTGFLWGAATAAYQIEGAANEDGRGESIWDRFSHTPGKVVNGDTGDVACDHYHRTREDIAILREIGVDAYRFSISWPRIIPGGTGSTNDAGLDFYDRLVDDLLAAGITPFVTLYHWDLPQALQDRGGWANRETVDAFKAYTDVVSRRLGDRVRNWITHNEPWCVAFLGNLVGNHAPGLTDLQTAISVAHHVLLSHGVSVPVIRDNSVPGAQVGITLNLNHVEPLTTSDADQAAAHRDDLKSNRWFLDPVFRGEYPREMVDRYEQLGVMAPIQAGDLECMAAPIDFLGVNNYFRTLVKAGPKGDGSDDEHVKPADGSYTAMGWEVWPDALRSLLVRLHRDYQPQRLYVTENGAAYADEVSTDGHVHDVARTDYIRGHIRAVQRATAEGAPVAGYFVWSFLDNFEWAEGYSKRFGIVYVDYPTQRRILKDSALYYSKAIR
ncbi:MAG: beta-glucosidase, partial [Chloroflexi bacterium]|nr:beta-glucosidase [Chloroflexota bacterium]